MKRELFCLMLLFFSVAVSAQDTIFVKSGEVIPAVIISKDNTEIQYKKFGQQEPAAIYSVFISEVKSIHYSDGIIADYSNQVSTGNRPKKPIDDAGSIGIGKWSFGIMPSRYNWNSEGELLEFWKNNPLMNNNTPLQNNPAYYALEFRMNLVLDRSKRNWIGTGMEMIFTPDDAIFAQSTDGNDAIRLNGIYANLPVYYGHSINHKKNLIAIFEPSLNLAFISGSIRMTGSDYRLIGNLGTGMNLGFGVDWIMTKRLHASFRVGQRYLKIKEQHVDEKSPEGFSTFYTNPSQGDDLLTMRINGTYASAGLYFSMYSRLKGFRME